MKWNYAKIIAGFFGLVSFGGMGNIVRILNDFSNQSGGLVVAIPMEIAFVWLTIHFWKKGKKFDKGL